MSLLSLPPSFVTFFFLVPTKPSLTVLVIVLLVILTWSLNFPDFILLMVINWIGRHLYEVLQIILSCFVHALVPGPPHNVRAVPVSKDTIRVLWEPPLEPNGIIRGYTVSFGIETSGSEEDEERKLLGNYTSLSLNLEPETTYHFGVKAKTFDYGNMPKFVKEKTLSKSEFEHEYKITDKQTGR